MTPTFLRSLLTPPSSPSLASLVCISEVPTEELVNSLAFWVDYDQALRVYLLRNHYDKKVALLSRIIKYLLEHRSVIFLFSPEVNTDSHVAECKSSSAPSVPSEPSVRLDTPRMRYRLLFFLRLITVVGWGPSNRAALLDAGVIDFLVQIVQTEVPDSYIAIIASHEHEDLDQSIPAVIREQGLAHLLGGPLAKTSRLVGLISSAFSALFPEQREAHSLRNRAQIMSR